MLSVCIKLYVTADPVSDDGHSSSAYGGNNSTGTNRRSAGRRRPRSQVLHLPALVHTPSEALLHLVLFCICNLQRCKHSSWYKSIGDCMQFARRLQGVKDVSGLSYDSATFVSLLSVACILPCIVLTAAVLTYARVLCCLAGFWQQRQQ
jgi:hypothetical protein